MQERHDEALKATSKASSSRSLIRIRVWVQTKIYTS